MEPGERLTPIREIKSKPTGMFAATQAARRTEGPAVDLPLLSIEGISKSYRIRKGGWFGGGDRVIQAVSDVGFEVKRGECLGLVGESGCGKTTLVEDDHAGDRSRFRAPSGFNDHGKHGRRAAPGRPAAERVPQEDPVRVPGSASPASTRA